MTKSQRPQLTARMLTQEAVSFEAMIEHRFVRDIEADSLPAPVFDRYLLIEGAFVETAIAIFGYAVARSEDLADRRKLIASLDALANQQMPYFEMAYEMRGLSPDPDLQSDPRVAAFRDGMLDIARHGSFAEILTAMFAAEWMYWTWCRRAAQASISDPMLADWVGLHADAGFAAQAQWLRDRLDRLGHDMDDAAQDAAVTVFGHVQRLEIAFHDAAYGPDQSEISAP
ncbi:TenA family protein [Paracoccus sp. Z330]|uniref:Aminopyrimidine aminohydrolase n=1 Tax=Paracoccus onchidii TaxID=3017813 RepID=A0ABT4ZAC4_9RHOB|nr:TenA family protein [Paracoccus onchidii]MDB6176304.1 TenA family protein [Paracoccus onchidii]